MDTTPEYIEMCRKAVEIQEAWKPVAGDFTLSHRDGVKPLESITIGLAELTPFGSNGSRIRADMTWLPRQDQLQGMFLSSEHQHILGLNDYFNRYWANNEYLEMFEGNEHLEPFWLAFVMDKKYGKKWDGAEWK